LYGRISCFCCLEGRKICYCATRDPNELVISRLAEQVGMNRATAETYQPWIEAAFLVHRLPAWSRKVASRPADAKAMATLRDRLDRIGDDFVCGIVCHTGDRRIKLGDRLVGLPIADLWT